MIDLTSPEMRIDPFPIYAKMRREQPVCPVAPAGSGMWAVFRYDDVRTVLQDSRRFSSKGFRIFLKPEWLSQSPAAHSMLVMDPPEHTKLRGLINRGFGQKLLDDLEPLQRAVVNDIVEETAARGETEFVYDVSARIAGAVIGRILGMDTSQYKFIRRWTEVLGAITPFPPDDQTRAMVEACVQEEIDYTSAAIAARRAEPRNDMVTQLINAEVDGQRLTDDELIAFLVLLLGAGFETTVHLLSKAMLMLTERPDLTDRLRADESLVPGFIDEMARYDSPVLCMFRLATEDVELSGTRIPAGSFVLPMLGSANRDPDKFPDPDTLDIGRKVQGSLSFGWGAHSCLGGGVAAQTARILFEGLLRGFQRFERVPGPVDWCAGMAYRGLSTLPLKMIRA